MIKSLLARIKSCFPSYVFTRIYTNRRWKGDSASGAGSSLEQTKALRDALPGLLKELKVQSILDIPCGDLYWFKEINLDGVHYVGADIVKPLVAKNIELYSRPDRTFLVANLISDPLPRCDAVLCRDCFVHLRNRDITAAIANIRKSGAQWLLTTTYTGDCANQDVLTGEWRAINLMLPPFNLPPPARLIDEKCTESGGRFSDKHLGVWRVSDLNQLSAS